MGMFSEWLKKDQGIEDPVGLEAAKNRVLDEGKEDFQHLAKKELKAKAEKKIKDIQNPPDASPTVPSEMPYTVQRGERKGEPVELKRKGEAAREREYFKLALDRRDQLEKKPRGPESLSEKVQRALKRDNTIAPSQDVFDSEPMNYSSDSEI